MCLLQYVMPVYAVFKKKERKKKKKREVRGSVGERNGKIHRV